MHAFCLPWGFQNHRMMKTWMMTLGLMTLASTMVAQDSRLSGKEGADQGGVYRSALLASEFYGTLVAFTQANNELVRFNVDDIVLRMTRDQDFLKAVEELRTYRFESTSQALNVLASHGWVLRSTMVLRGRNGDERHYVMARPTELMMPVSPWLERRAGAGAGQR